VITFHGYQPEHLPELIAVWNTAFSGGPNFTSLTEQDFIDRVAGQPSFDPETLRAAEDGGRIVGTDGAGISRLRRRSLRWEQSNDV